MSAPYVDIYDNTVVVYTKIKELNTDLTSFTVDNFVTYDVAFKIPRPVADYYLPKDFALNESTAMPERLRYSVDFEYNYFSDDYELLMGDLFNNPAFGAQFMGGNPIFFLKDIIKDLPDLYLYYYFNNLQSTLGYSQAQAFSALSDFLTPQVGFVTQLGQNTLLGNYDEFNYLSRNYFINWARDYIRGLTISDVFQDILPAKERTNLIISRDGQQILTYEDNKVENFPMHAKISFDTPSGPNVISELIYDIGNNMQNTVARVFMNNGIYENSYEIIERRYQILFQSLGEQYINDEIYAYMSSSPALYIKNASITEKAPLFWRDSNTNLSGPVSTYHQRLVHGTSESVVEEGKKVSILKLSNFMTAVSSSMTNPNMSNNTFSFTNSSNACSSFMQMIQTLQFQNSVNSFLSTVTGENYTEVLMFRVDKVFTNFQDRNPVPSQDSVDPVIRSYWFFNRAGTEIIDLLDTQVLYGGEYTYKCYAYVLCEAELTSFSINRTDDTNGLQVPQLPSLPEVGFSGDFFKPLENVYNVPNNLASAESNNDTTDDYADPNFYVNNPNVNVAESQWVIVEIPYFQDSVKILDSPPVEPDVRIVGYRGVSDKVLMMFESPVEQRFERPISILPDVDYDNFIEQIISQKAYGDRLAPIPSPAIIDPTTGEPYTSPPTGANYAAYIHSLINGQNLDLSNTIMFETDDPPLLIQTFRLRVQPTEYADFANGRIVDVPCYIDNPVEGSLNPYRNFYSTSFEDELEPNVKYYYCFRSIDIHGNFSNPSPVYEIEMFKENETIYLKQRIVDFAPKIKFDNELTFKKYIKIAPAVEQNQIPMSVLGTAESATDFLSGSTQGTVDMPLGTKQHKLWGKNFVVRITSKQTGKSVDFDVNFTNNGIIIPEE